MARYGYVRVSSADQKIDRQIRALTEEGIDSADIFIDRKSGRDFDRPEWRRMLKTLRQDDTVVVLSIDRMVSSLLPFGPPFGMIVSCDGQRCVL